MALPVNHRSSSRLRVRYGETDQMGVAYHAHYLVWCEVGRTDFIRELGTTYADIERQGHFLAVAEAAVRYGAAARYDDLLRVDTWIESARSRAITFRYRIEREEPQAAPIATAHTTLVSIDRAGAPRKLPASILDLFTATS